MNRVPAMPMAVARSPYFDGPSDRAITNDAVTSSRFPVTRARRKSPLPFVGSRRRGRAEAVNPCFSRYGATSRCPSITTRTPDGSAPVTDLPGSRTPTMASSTHGSLRSSYRDCWIAESCQDRDVRARSGRASRPWVTVAIPVFNEEVQIAGCLEAILAQTYQQLLEILVVDGGSSDHTCDVACGFAHVRGHRQPTAGAGRRTQRRHRGGERRSGRTGRRPHTRRL